MLKSTFGIFREHLFFPTMARNKYISHSLFPDEYLLKTNLCPRVNPSLFGYSGYFPLLARKRHEKEISHQIHLVGCWGSFSKDVLITCENRSVMGPNQQAVSNCPQTAENTLLPLKQTCPQRRDYFSRE